MPKSVEVENQISSCWHWGLCSVPSMATISIWAEDQEVNFFIALGFFIGQGEL